MLSGNGLARFCFLVFWLNLMEIRLCAIPSRATLLQGEGENIRHPLENSRDWIGRTLIRQPEVNRWQLRDGDERPVEALNHGWRCVGVGERPNVGGRVIRGDRRPVREGDVRAGLQGQEKIRRGVEDDGRVGGCSGDAGKFGGLRRWQTAAIPLKIRAPGFAVCNPASWSVLG
jgi:hypothetical protein